ncbi:MAG TPA: dihydroneopterin aldolase [Mucilaginibacter sp.]|nr:dihydroneopterin aldolase [Mucilaginibacter sp.]
MITVALHGAEFFGKHGFYPEEQLIGSKFVVDISVEFEPPDGSKSDNLANTVNYEQLYTIAFEQMQKTKKLIETLGQAIVDAIKSEYPYIETATVMIKKLNPPMPGKVDYSSVAITYNRPANGIQ